LAGTGTAAVRSMPQGLAVDSQGLAYVADGGLHCIRKVSPEGVVVTFAGAITNGAPSKVRKEGVGSSATFSTPFGLALDPSSGVLYVGDTGFNMIRMVSPSGVVSTYAGSGASSPHTDGAAGIATFKYPQGIALSGSGLLFVVDTFSHCIRMITPGVGSEEAVVSTLAGMPGVSSPFSNGKASAATFYYPKDIAVDADSGVVYVADSNNLRIRMITLGVGGGGGVVSTYAGSGASGPFLEGPASQATLTPSCVAVHKGVVYVVEPTRVRMITPP
jgi:DNA-binding beta-propeller fold protein YncE